MASIAVLPVLLGLGGRLRDPVPGARAGGRAAGALGAADRHRGAGHRRRASWCWCSRRCRWCGGFGAAAGRRDRGRARAGADRRDGAADARGAPAPGRRAAGALAARRGRPARRRGRRARPGARAGAAGGPRRARGDRDADPGRVLAAALAAAAVGWAVDTRADVVSDLQRLVPQDLARAARPRALQSATGVAGEVDVLRRGPRPHRPAGRRLDAPTTRPTSSSGTATPPRAAAGGPSCARRSRCPTCSAPAPTATRAQVRGAAGRRAAVLLPGGDHARPAHGELAFGIRLQSLAAPAARSFQDMRARLHPPPGVRARARRRCPCWPPTPTTR